MTIRKAKKEDVYAIVGLLADDELGQLREEFSDPLPARYYEAFEQINQDNQHFLMVMVDDQDEVIGTFQLSFIPYLTYRGGTRAQIEAVRIRRDKRGKGIGEQFFNWAIDKAKARKAHVLQLTTDKKRPEALHFYEKLGFRASHEGMKLHFSY